MNEEKVHIKVFITKSKNFRAIIKESYYPQYEVTVGGKRWDEGKGLEYKKEILIKCVKLIGYLESQLNTI